MVLMDTISLTALTDTEHHIRVDVLVDVDVANPLTVAEDRDVTGGGLDMLHKLLGATGDD